MKLILGDCLEKLKELPDNSVDTIITDPPYGLKFMGKKWDYDVPSVDIWKECLRVLKPGGHLLSFAGTRTQHKMAVNIEDAGFEIRDTIMWLYGSGFPKSMNISKALEAKEKYGKTNTVAKKQVEQSGNGKEYKIKQTNNGAMGEIVETTRKVYIPSTELAKQWQGWGTALKPAYEPIIVARKPFKGSLVDNVLTYGVGGINIDECRVPLENGETIATNVGFLDNLQSDGWVTKKCITEKISQGRFPANVIHDGSDEVVGLFPQTKSGKAIRHNSGGNTFGGDNEKPPMEDLGYDDSGSASRFFYCAKASKKERNIGCEGLEEKPKVFNGQSDKPSEDMKDVEKRFTTLPVANFHPTVKPLALMEYLVKLVSREGQVVLDPFMGSGTTGMACVNTGRDFIGIEIDEDYFKIAQARIESCKESRQLTFE